jgi:Arc/MetJ-type ribon-helix-helix transcriptional regulator
MKRTTITLPDDVFEAAEREAKRRRTSVSEVVREAVAKTLGCQPASEDARRARHEAGQRYADELDEVLAQEWPAAIMRHRDA